jgi:two-component system, NarL family, nitrate/nitrite response regulator NarL
MRVLIVDDHSMFCDGLKLLLETLGVASQVAACNRTEQALLLVKEEPWDLILVDWNMGAGSTGGAELIALFMALQPQTRVVVISAESRAQRVHEAIEAGAVGFVPKEASSELLIDAIRVTSHGSIYLPASVLNEPVSDAADHKFDEVLSLQAAYPHLTPRQIDVLICTVKGQSNKLIARSLGISDGTVKQHLNAIYRELCVGSRTEAIYLLASRGVKVF